MVLLSFPVPLLWSGASGASTGGRPSDDHPSADVVSIASVSPWVAADGEFQVRFEPSAAVPPGAAFVATVHSSLDVDGTLRGAVDDIVEGRSPGRVLRTPLRITEFGDPQEGAVVTIPIRSQRGDPDRVLLPNPGIHPVELTLVAEDSTDLWHQVVFLNRLPVERDGVDPRPPVNVTLLLPLGTGPAIGDDGSGAFTIEERSSLGSIGALLDRVPDVPLTIAPRPNTLDGLLLTDEVWAQGLLATLAEQPSAHELLALPYVAADTGGLVSSGAAAELTRQIDLGRLTAERVARRGVRRDTWALDDTVTQQSLATLARAGIESMLLPESALDLDTDSARDAGLDEEAVSSRPVRLAGDSGIRALAFDGDLSTTLAAAGAAPGAQAHTIVTMLMATWFDQPSDASGPGPASVMVVTPTTDPDVLNALHPSLSGDGPLQARAGAAPVPPEDPDDADPVVALAPRRVTDQRGAVGAADDTRRITDAYRSMVGDADPTLWARERITDQTMSVGVDNGRRLEMHLAVRDGIDAELAKIEMPRARRVVVTSRETTIPLRFRNDLPFEVTLVLRTRSTRLEVIGGDTRTIVLQPGENRIDLPVTVQAPGESLLRVELFSPTPGIELDGPNVPVRSTAISGVGAALSILSTLFLVGWWIHTHRRRRRAEARVEGAHPSGRPGADSLRSGG